MLQSLVHRSVSRGLRQPREKNTSAENGKWTILRRMASPDRIKRPEASCATGAAEMVYGRRGGLLLGGGVLLSVRQEAGAVTQPAERAVLQSVSDAHYPPQSCGCKEEPWFYF